ncbi:hypothetical protein EKO04_007289 [Ascochyta lentis]|uniref:Uncharacterized protein n=1 Tax=Ascochyta lentis TaxID=205686 RepID=A0A8H7IZM5_9PLEO|nr:hypothetical protein EKO04_007289 [Ascochyta lentis]
MLSAFVEDTKIQCRAIAEQIKANQEERALDDELHEQEVYLLERENNKLQEKINTLEHKMNTLKEEKEKLLTNEQKRSQEAEAEINNWKEKCEQLQERWDRAVKCFAS